MAAPKLGLILENEAEFKAALLSLPKSMRERGLPDALRLGGKIIIARARQIAPKDSGALRASIGQYVRKPKRNRKFDPYSVIGPREGYSKTVTRTGFGGSFVYTEKATPANYAHLVELGHHIVIGGTLDNTLSGGRIRASKRQRGTGRGTATSYILPRPFLRPAFIESAKAVRQKLIESLKTFHVREAARISRRFAKKGK